MGLEMAKATVRVRGDASRLKSDFNAARPGILGSLRGLAAAATGILATIGLGIGLSKLFSIGREAIGLAERQIDAQARLAAVIKTTGESAGFTAKQLMEQASAFQAATTIGDEAILETQAILATFRNISGEAFTETTERALDLAGVLGTDAKSAAIQLGKALNDPVANLSALSRAGIQFTDVQKEQIKGLVEQGNLQQAQKLILSELKVQFGGVARAMAKTDSGKLKQAKNILDDMKEDLGKKLIPLMSEFVNLQIDLGKKFGESLPFIQAGFKLLVDGIKTVVDFWSSSFNAAFEFVKTSLNPLVVTFKNIFSAIVSNLDIMLGSWEGLGAGIVKIMGQAVIIFKAMWEDAKAFFNINSLQMQGSFLKVWNTIALGATNILTPMFTRMRLGWKRMIASMNGEKLLITNAEIERQARGDTAEALKKVFQQRMKNEKDTNEAIKSRRENHERKILKFRRESKELEDRFKEATKDLPTLSGRFKDALAAILGKDLPEIVAPGLAGGIQPAAAAVAAKPSFGRTGISGFGASLQDALLKPADKNHKEAQKQRKQADNNNVNRLDLLLAELKNVGLA